MRISTLCAFLLTRRMAMNTIALPNYVPTKSGLFPLLVFTGVDDAVCHECLVISLGCAKLYLLQVIEKMRLYWVEGHPDIPSSFLSYCHTHTRCNFYLVQPTNDDIIKPKIAFSQLSIHSKSYKNIERALFSLVNPTSTEVISLRAFGLSTDWKHNFLIKNEGSIPLFS